MHALDIDEVFGSELELAAALMSARNEVIAIKALDEVAIITASTEQMCSGEFGGFESGDVEDIFFELTVEAEMGSFFEESGALRHIAK